MISHNYFSADHSLTVSANPNDLLFLVRKVLNKLIIYMLNITTNKTS